MAGGFRWLAGNPENTFMKALQHHSTFSNVSTDDFRQLLEDFQVKSFYETLPLGRFGLVSMHIWSAERDSHDSRSLSRSQLLLAFLILENSRYL